MLFLKTVFFALLINVVFCAEPERIIGLMSVAMGRSVLDCRKEIPFSDDVVTDFLQFWEPHHTMKDMELGCVVLCVMIKLQLMEIGGTPNVNNIAGFVRANGGDGDILKSVVTVYEECMRSVKFGEPCATGLALASCFRRKVFKLQWAPQPGVYYEDPDF